MYRYIYVYICTGMYIYVQVYTYVYIYIYIYVDVYTHVRVCREGSSSAPSDLWFTRKSRTFRQKTSVFYHNSLIRMCPIRRALYFLQKSPT